MSNIPKNKAPFPLPDRLIICAELVGVSAVALAEALLTRVCKHAPEVVVDTATMLSYNGVKHDGKTFANKRANRSLHTKKVKGSSGVDSKAAGKDDNAASRRASSRRS